MPMARWDDFEHAMPGSKSSPFIDVYVGEYVRTVFAEIASARQAVLRTMLDARL
jgi:hypothetical protein